VRARGQPLELGGKALRRDKKRLREPAGEDLESGDERQLTSSGSLKCLRTRARHSSVTSRSSRVVRSENSNAARSRSLKCGC
jgi:hypothetical protein